MSTKMQWSVVIVVLTLVWLAWGWAGLGVAFALVIAQHIIVAVWSAHQRRREAAEIRAYNEGEGKRVEEAKRQAKEQHQRDLDEWNDRHGRPRQRVSDDWWQDL